MRNAIPPAFKSLSCKQRRSTEQQIETFQAELLQESQLNLNYIVLSLGAAGIATFGLIANSEKWKDIVQLSGPRGLRLIKGFHDESLLGEWEGHRSSRLSKQYRVIYKILKEEVVIKVVDLTAHDDRRQ